MSPRHDWLEDGHLPAFAGTLLEAANAAGLALLITVDDQGGPRGAYASEAAGELVGVPAAKLVGRTMLEFVVPEDLGRVNELRDRFFSGESNPRRISVIVRRIDGTRVPVEVSGASVEHDDQVVSILFFDRGADIPSESD